jgi:hypothetical protein
VSVVVVGASVRDVVGACKFGKDNITARAVCNWNEMSNKQKSKTKEISNFVNVISWSVVWKIIGYEDGRNTQMRVVINTNILFFEVQMH